MFVVLICLFIAVYSLIDSIVEYSISKHGQPADAQVVAVKRVVARRLARKRPELLPCDYLLQISYQSASGSTVDTNVFVKAHMKVVKGRSVPLFAQGDKIKVLYHRRFVGRAQVVLETTGQKRFGLLPLLMWAASCALLLVLLLFTGLSS